MDLTNAELERLAILMEECAEVQHIIGKIIRHGYASFNPIIEDCPPCNRELLEKELGDLSFAVNFCADNKDINLLNVRKHTENKKESIQNWLHFNKVDNN